MNKNIIALGFVSFFTDMASSMVTTILPLFIVYVLNEGVDKLGYVIAVTTFVSYIFRVLFGFLSDKYQVVKPFVVIGYTISAITKPFLYFANNWQEIAFLRGLERMGKAIRSATKDTLISAYSQNRSGKNFGFHKMLDVAGKMSGAIIAFLALFYLGKNEQIFRNLFALTLIPGIIAVIVIVFFVKDVPCKKKSKEFNLKDDFHLLPMLFIYFGVVFFMFSDSYFIVAAKNSFSMEYIPLLVILLYFTQTVLSYYLGVKIDELGSGKIFFYSIIFGIFALIALYFNLIIIGFIMLGIFTVGTLNSIRSYISNNAKNKSTVYGIFYGGVAVFNSLGAMIIGIIWKNYGIDKALIFSLIGLVLTALFYRLKYVK
jgi:MFS family permease